MQEGTIIEVVRDWLRDAKKPLSDDAIDRAAEHVADRMIAALPEGVFDKHIPLDVIALVEQGLMSVPLAPEYELHRMACETCARNYEYAIAHMGDVQGIKNANKEIWVSLKREEGLYREKMLKALQTSSRICVVSGEIIEDVFDEELCEEVKRFAERGNEFSMLAGPMVEERSDKRGVNYFLDMLRNDETLRIDLFVADRRQDLHFAYSDTEGFIYLEAPHKSSVDERDYLFAEKIEDDNYRRSLYSSYVRERFEASFASPDVRLWKGDEKDIIVRDGKLLEMTGQMVDDSGLNIFGRFGISALIDLEGKGLLKDYSV